jgi:antitoxin MazE
MLLLCKNIVGKMEIRIIRIGNSKGIILSKAILDRYGIKERVELVMKDKHFEVKAVKPPRQGWEQAFKRMHEQGDDQLLDHDVLDDDIFEDWEWEDGDPAV